MNNLNLILEKIAAESQEKIDAVNEFLCQDVNDKFDFEDTEKMLEALFK